MTRCLIAIVISIVLIASCEVSPDECRSVQVQIIRGGADRDMWSVDTTFTERWCWITVHDTITQAHLMPDSPYVYVDTSYWTYQAWIKE